MSWVQILQDASCSTGVTVAHEFAILGVGVRFPCAAMSRYRGPRIRLFKRLGYLPGFGFNPKFQKFKKIKLRSNTKKKNRERESFTIRLKEKQKLRYNYGLTERNLLQYVQKARKRKNTNFSTGQRLFNSLEMRLDNIVFKLGFGETLPAARQLITHGHILLNGQKRTIPSSQCQPNDIITMQSTASEKYPIPPTFLVREGLTGKIQQLPSSDYLKSFNSFNQLLVIEYYSNRKGRNG